MARAVTDVLVDAGYIVDRVAQGRAALERLLHRLPDLMLLDLGLPDIDGMEACRLARRHAPDMPIIILTGRTETRDVVAGLGQGADDYVCKPFDLNVLLARIGALLRARKQPDGCGADNFRRLPGGE